MTIDGRRSADVAVIAGRIASITPHGSHYARVKRTIHADGLLVLPGAVDPHCHFGTFLDDSWAEPECYSAAAAFGGTTTVLDFVFQSAPASLHEAVQRKREQADGEMAVDYGLHAVVTGDISFEVLDEIPDIIQSGIPSVKTFMTYRSLVVDDGHRWAVMREVADHGGLSLVHAEDDAIAAWLTKRSLRRGNIHGSYISETHPALVEEAAVRRALLLAERAESPIYILHVSSAAALAAITQARTRGLPVYGETLLTYLSFTNEQVRTGEDGGLLWNNFPPLKCDSDRRTLREAVKDDRLQVVSSDQWANTYDERMASGTTIDRLQSGQAAVELRVPVLFHLLVNSGMIELERFVEVVATNPAKLMGIYPEKGDLQVGSDADIVLFDPHATWTIRHEDLHMRADWNCWDDWEITGRVALTLLRGEIMVEHGRWVGPRGSGHFLKRRRWDGPPTTTRSVDTIASAGASAAV